MISKAMKFSLISKAVRGIVVPTSLCIMAPRAFMSRMHIRMNMISMVSFCFRIAVLIGGGNVSKSGLLSKFVVTTVTVVAFQPPPKSRPGPRPGLKGFNKRAQKKSSGGTKAGNSAKEESSDNRSKNDKKSSDTPRVNTKKGVFPPKTSIPTKESEDAAKEDTAKGHKSTDIQTTTTKNFFSKLRKRPLVTSLATLNRGVTTVFKTVGKGIKTTLAAFGWGLKKVVPFLFTIIPIGFVGAVVAIPYVLGNLFDKIAENVKKETYYRNFDGVSSGPTNSGPTYSNSGSYPRSNIPNFGGGFEIPADPFFADFEKMLFDIIFGRTNANWDEFYETHRKDFDAFEKRKSRDSSNSGGYTGGNQGNQADYQHDREKLTPKPTDKDTKKAVIQMFNEDYRQLPKKNTVEQKPIFKMDTQRQQITPERIITDYRLNPTANRTILAEMEADLTSLEKSDRLKALRRLSIKYHPDTALNKYHRKDSAVKFYYDGKLQNENLTSDDFAEAATKIGQEILTLKDNIRALSESIDKVKKNLR